jgi:hypothetical protein
MPSFLSEENDLLYIFSSQKIKNDKKAKLTKIFETFLLQIN